MRVLLYTSSWLRQGALSLVKKSHAKWRPHFDENSQSVPQSVSSLSLSIITSIIRIMLTTIRSDSGVEIQLIILSFCWRWLLFFLPYHAGEAIRWFSGSYIASNKVVVDWVKLASFTIMKEINTNRYTNPVCLWYLGLAWLELQVFWGLFFCVHSFHCNPF